MSNSPRVSDVSMTLADVRNRYANKSWEIFSTFLQQTPPLNGETYCFICNVKLNYNNCVSY